MQFSNAVMQAIRSEAGLFPPSAEEMERAQQVQARLLHRRTPRLDHLEYGGCYLPACGVGGDYYDFLHLGLGRVGFALGDVSGKGIPAALMMASLQAILRSHAPILGHDLKRLMRAVNRNYCECTGESSFASLFWGDYDDATRVLRYVNCGHNPPLLIRRDLCVTRLEATATVLGVFRDWDGSICTATLAPGDVLLLFTDGVTEAMNAAGEEFGECRLLEELERNMRLALPSLVKKLTAAVRKFTGNILKDDVTLVVARSIAPN
jgi:serine phosphatase RsbU (regulator of sigma subunit)